MTTTSTAKRYDNPTSSGAVLAGLVEFEMERDNMEVLLYRPKQNVIDLRRMHNDYKRG
jgi:hypothetical protein